MILTHLQLSNFKSYESWEGDLCSNVNCFVGDNGVGKTNLLDAVYYLSFCKSFFNNIDQQNIRYGQEYFALHGRYVADEGEEPVMVGCVQKRGHPKQMKWNKKSYKTFAEHIGKIPLVMVSPQDQSLILGGSELRRKFVDGVIAQTDKGYLQTLLQYQKALEQRNKLLKQFYEDRSWDDSAIALWDEQLSRQGEVLYASRRQFVKDFEPLFQEYFNWISNGSEEAKLAYQTQQTDDAEGKAQTTLKQLLEESHQADKYTQYTTVGPHKDDFMLHLRRPDGETVPIRKYGSQGQQKTYLLALKLAQFEYLYRQCGSKPILLLDDIFDKLDMKRVSQLLKLVAGDRFGQVLLTDTQSGRVNQLLAEIPQEHKIFEID